LSSPVNFIESSRRSISVLQPAQVTNRRDVANGVPGGAPQSARTFGARRAWMIGLAEVRDQSIGDSFSLDGSFVQVHREGWRLRMGLKVGDKVRWKATSRDIMTFVEGQRGEVVSISQERDGPHTTFRNLDHQGTREHIFVFVGDILESVYELIS